jgi:hypothetical protein
MAVNVTERNRFVASKRLVLAGLAGTVVLTLAACGGGSSSSTTVAPSSSAAPSATVEPVATQAPTADDAAALKAAVAALGSTYHFVTTAQINGSTVLTAEGDHVGDGARLTLTSDAGSVLYVVTAAGSWAKPENGDWAVLDVPQATTDPVNALSNPSAVALVPDSPEGQDYAAVVANDALGISGGGTATLVVTVVDGRVVKIAYGSVVANQAAQVTTVLGAAKNPDPVVAPI